MGCSAPNREHGESSRAHSLPMQDLSRVTELLHARLDALWPTASSGAGGAVEQAARYALLAPGKRVRPLLALAACLEYGGALELALDAACAVEMVHAASLILDDLPCMDDAQMRRGRPATHRAFGEAAGLLAAIALLNRAYAVIAAEPRLPPEVRLGLIARLSAAIGPEGLVGGQAADLHERPGYQRCEAVDELNRRKTGALFAAALELGARCAGASDASAALMGAAGERLGLAFQTIDDVLDQTEASAALGKDANKDQGKPSVASLAGLAEARARARQEIEAALAQTREAGARGGVLAAYLTEAFQAALA